LSRLVAVVRLLGSRIVEVSDGCGGTAGGRRGVATAQAAFERFAGQRNVLLTTYRRDGRPVGTPVHIAVDGAGERAFVRTWDTAWKLKRLRRNPAVEVAPSTFRGTPTGPVLRAKARILDGEEAAVAARALSRKYPVLHGALIPLVHRLRRNRTMHVELTVGRLVHEWSGRHGLQIQVPTVPFDRSP
jgi:PPOX class probable F420-dependent enzyme